MEEKAFVKGEPQFYAPTSEPTALEIPPMRFLMIDGQGDPNEENGTYQQAVGMLFSLAYTLKMSGKGDHAPLGYFPYSVAPLEGLWSMASGMHGVDLSNKSGFAWTAMIRQPDFVTDDALIWAKQEVLRKKKIDASAVRLETYAEGLCVQCLHIGPYQDEPATVARMETYLLTHRLTADHAHRRHHEIYLKSPQRTAPDKLHTILRIPVTLAAQ